MKRLVEIYVVDPDEKMPVEKSIVYEGPRKLTDSEDRDLFFELNMTELVLKHNKVREETMVDDKFTGRKVPLKPIKVSDLRMTVVNIASF
jgi:hypothetical protein